MRKDLLKRIKNAAKKLAFSDRRFTERQIYQTLKRQCKAGDMEALSAVLDNS